MSVSRSVASAALTLMLLSAPNAFAAAPTSAATDETAQHAATFGTAAQSLAQNRAAQCVNGYRITHQVKNQGRLTGGVILKCRS